MMGHKSMTASFSSEESGDGSGEINGDMSFKRSVTSPSIARCSCIISALSCLRLLFTIITFSLRILTCSDKSLLEKEETESELLIDPHIWLCMAVLRILIYNPTQLILRIE